MRVVGLSVQGVAYIRSLHERKRTRQTWEHVTVRAQGQTRECSTGRNDPKSAGCCYS